MRFKNDMVDFFPMHNGKYRASYNGKHSLGFDTPKLAIDAVVRQLSTVDIANRLYVMYSVKVMVN